MKKFKYVIKDALGIHARPAGLLVKEALKYESSVMVDNGKKQADAKKIMAVIAMGTKKGMEVTVTIQGSDEDDALSGLREFFEKRL